MVEEIVSGVYDITCDDTNGKRYRVFLFDTDIPTLVDAGLESTVESVFDGIDEIGVEPERLIITHGDGDPSVGSKRSVTGTSLKPGFQSKQKPRLIQTIDTEMEM